LIGVSGANLYAPQGQGALVTRDYDLFLPLDINEVRSRLNGSFSLSGPVAMIARVGEREIGS
jgi:hypothetical protein